MTLKSAFYELGFDTPITYILLGIAIGATIGAYFLARNEEKYGK